jgi:pimeloyl-ACP methyl ester carboxylesterase
VNVLSQGEGPDVVLIHGLGATKTSFFDATAALSRAGYRVHALDLPGFGSSSKPLLASYDAPWFARTVLGVLDALDIDRAHLVGNSMGGRVAIEMGLMAPQRIGGMVLLCPAVAFVRRAWHPLVRLLRPEFGLLPHGFSRETVERQLFAMFADPDALDPAVADVAVDEFQRIYGSAAARHAFLASARNIYLSRPFGDRGFYPALSGLQPPALFIWGTRDPLIPAGFSRHVREWLPSAEQIVLERCGHVPQIERPEQTSGIIRRFFERADALGPTAPVARQAA